MDARPTTDGAADRLPAGPAVFAGRRTELAALRAAAARPAAGRSPVLVLAGRPGSGRTTLAVRFARSVADDYPDGTLFARLSAPDGSRVPPGQVARRLLEQLGGTLDAMLLPGAGQDGRDDPACVRLRAALAGRRVLLLLDDVRDAGQLWPLLADEPGCLVVATTAGPLTGIEDIDPCILGGLEQRTSVALLGDLVGGNRISCDPVGGADLAEACASRPAALRLMAGWLRGNPKAAVTDAARELAQVTAAAPGKGAAGGAAPDKAAADKTGAVGAGVGPDAPDKAAPGTPAPGTPAGGQVRAAAGKTPQRPAAKARKGRPAVPAPPATPPAPPAAPAAAPAGPAPAASAPPAAPAGGEPVPVPDNDPLIGAFTLLYGTLPAAQARMLRTLTLAPAQIADLRTASALVLSLIHI